MGRFAPIVLAVLALGGCHDRTVTPLAEALYALRNDDPAQLKRAIIEADRADYYSWQPGLDPCSVTPKDIESVGEAKLVHALDRPALFHLSEPARFVYAVKVAGIYDAALKAGNTSPAALLLMGKGPLSVTNVRRKCGPRSKLALVMIAIEGTGDDARVAALQDWQKSLRSRYSEPGAYGSAMQKGVGELKTVGLVAQWPEPLEFSDTIKALPTFGEIRRQMQARQRVQGGNAE